MRRNSAEAGFRRQLRAVINSMPNAARPITAETIRAVTGAGINSIEELEAVPLDSTLPPETVAAACWLLGALKTGRAEEALLAALRHAEPRVRMQAAVSLTRFCSTKAVMVLLEALSLRDDVDMRSVAVYSLGEIGDQRAVGPLLAVLSDIRETSKVRAEAADALATLGAHEAIPELLCCLANESAELRFWAVHALGKLGSAEILPRLLVVAEGDRECIERWGSVAAEAREAIMHIEWREAHR